MLTCDLWPSSHGANLKILDWIYRKACWLHMVIEYQSGVQVQECEVMVTWTITVSRMNVDLCNGSLLGAWSSGILRNSTSYGRVLCCTSRSTKEMWSRLLSRLNFLMESDSHAVGRGQHPMLTDDDTTASMVAMVMQADVPRGGANGCLPRST